MTLRTALTLLAATALLPLTTGCEDASAADTLAPSSSPETEEALALLAEIRAKETCQPTPTHRRARPLALRHAPPPPPVVDGRPTTYTAGLEIRMPGRPTKHLLVVRHQRKVMIRNRKLRSSILYRQNPIAAWEISAAAVDHPHQCVIDFTFADLRDEGMPHAVEDLVGLGIRVEELASMKASGEVKTAFGETFSRLVRREPDTTPGSLQEVWWHEARRIPLEIRRQQVGDVQVQRLVAFRLTHEARNLEHPSERLKTYRRVDLADFREDHLGCGKRISQATGRRQR